MQRGFTPIIVILLVVVIVAALGGAFYWGRLSSTPSEQVSSTPTPSQTIKPNDTPDQPLRPSIRVTRTQVKPPKDFGYTKVTDLKGIGVKAAFPESAKIKWNDPSQYYVAEVVNNNNYDTVSFSIEEYSGGGRREWFNKKRPLPEQKFESFVGKNHNGYIATYAKPTDTGTSLFHYFAVIRPNKMLVITGYNDKNQPYFFNQNLEKFRSFLSTVEIITPQAVQNNTTSYSDIYRQSSERKTLWEDSGLGLKVTGPTWIETRVRTGVNEDGSPIFSEWKNSTPGYNNYSQGEDVNLSFYAGYSAASIVIYANKFKDQPFDEIVNEMLPAGGSCAREWKSDKSQCTNPSGDYCYTKEEVLSNLILKKQTRIGSLDAQLRSINTDFSDLNDCRGTDIWLIKAKTGQLMTSELGPDGDWLRIEGT